MKFNHFHAHTKSLTPKIFKKPASGASAQQSSGSNDSHIIWKTRISLTFSKVEKAHVKIITNSTLKAIHISEN